MQMWATGGTLGKKIIIVKPLRMSRTLKQRDEGEGGAGEGWVVGSKMSE